MMSSPPIKVELVNAAVKKVKQIYQPSREVHQTTVVNEGVDPGHVSSLPRLTPPRHRSASFFSLSHTGVASAPEWI